MSRLDTSSDRMNGLIGDPEATPAARGSKAGRARPKQLALELRTHGGRRRGAGRKPKGPKAGVSHHGRPVLPRALPVHVTLRVREHVWNLRSRRCERVLHAALAGIAPRAPGFRVAHYSLQGNHLHLVTEATSNAALSNGVNALAVRLARGLNALMGTRGKVFSDRHHAHVLRTPAEVRNALSYVRGNFASHARRRGERPPSRGDPFASASPLSAPRTWLLRAGSG